MLFGGRAAGLGWSQETGCTICGSPGDCRHWPEIESPFTTKDWSQPMPSVKKGQAVYAARRIFVDGRLAYAPGDIVPHDHAVKLGLIEAPAAELAEPEQTAEPVAPTPDETAKARTEARARRQGSDRQTVAPEDRSA